MLQRRGRFGGTFVTCLRLSPRVIRGGRAQQGVTNGWNAARFRSPGSPSPFPFQAVQLAQLILHQVELHLLLRIRNSEAPDGKG